MQKNIILFISVMLILAGGYIGMRYFKQKEKEEKFWKEQEARVEKYIHYNIKDVKSITFEEHGVSPMGVPYLNGYINKDTELNFNANIIDSKNFEENLNCSGELDKLIQKPDKSVSEIEKEEKEKKQE
ncbi:DUF1433 domain-containing protein [Bacillus sp. 3103sda1]|uniref:DUF1433 domain-containing protein n=1 Tax=Bacillus sp. 3103sda1 TaxID=2953808 RepID=UPI00209F135F|nr:DUF1433 domain-containing protein [Bacillus sp. 3103sda1]MCP1122690.1 DUF1433 domain-containing protein [Bacillus sp. 3103sda1]